MSTRTLPRRLLTKAQVAADLDISDRTLTRYIEQGRITTVRLGPRKVRIDADELERFRAELADQAEAKERRRHVAALVAKAPPLTADQDARITAVLKASA